MFYKKGGFELRRLSRAEIPISTVAPNQHVEKVLVQI
jgi:hypothetical protein